MQSRRSSRLALGTLILALLAGLLVPLAAANQIAPPQFADSEFQEVWDRYDRPVYFGEVARSYTWGGQISNGFSEPYRQGPNGRHLVQYFDKSRMEINDPQGNRDNPFFVTQGLLARDMIRGEVQEGDADFRTAEAAQIPFGDLDDVAPSSPTYATFQKVLDAAPVPAGRPITAAIDRAGNVSNSADSRGVTSVGVIPGVGTGHSIASVFYEFLQQSGPIYEGGRNLNAAVYTPTFYVTGLPITEAYWSRVKAAGQFREVLIQCFERRCLTYAPSNSPAFRVELANTGLQYFNWRYPNDQKAPVLSELKVGSITATGVTITWTTDEPATTEVRYGTTDGYGRFQGDLTLVKQHSATLSGLSPNQEYHFAVSSADAGGNRATSGDNTFKTRPQSQAPTISDAAVAAKTSTSATISFGTEPATTAKVIYYQSADPSIKTVVEGSATGRKHRVTLNGLLPDTEYTYQIEVSSEGGQTTSAPATFETDPATPEPTPSPTPSPTPTPKPAP